MTALVIVALLIRYGPVIQEVLPLIDAGMSLAKVLQARGVPVEHAAIIGEAVDHIEKRDWSTFKVGETDERYGA